MATLAQSTDACAADEERRGHPRVVVALPAFVHVDGTRHAVQLLDLSPAGARLKGTMVFPVGTKVRLDCGTLGRAAVVRWQDGDLIGVWFDVELDDREVAVQVQRSKALAAWLKARECETAKAPPPAAAR
jgi:hypothetical protein